MVKVRNPLQIAALFISFGLIVSAPRPSAAAGGTIQGNVFKDTNANGRFDPGEEVGGAVVEITNAAGSVLANAMTGFSGTYSAYALPAGTLNVRLKSAPGVLIPPTMTAKATVTDGGTTRVDLRITSPVKPPAPPAPPPPQHRP